MLASGCSGWSDCRQLHVSSRALPDAVVSGNLLLCSDTSTATPSLCGALLAVFGRDPLWTVIALVVVVKLLTGLVVSIQKLLRAAAGRLTDGKTWRPKITHKLNSERLKTETEGACYGVGVVMVSSDIPVVSDSGPNPRCPLNRNARIYDQRIVADVWSGEGC